MLRQNFFYRKNIKTKKKKKKQRKNRTKVCSLRQKEVNVKFPAENPDI